MSKKIVPAIIVASVTTVAAAVLAFALLRQNGKVNEMQQTIDRLQETEPAQTTEPFLDPAPVNHHYDLAGEKILLSDETFGEIYIPVLKDVQISQHPIENIETLSDKRRLSLDKDGNRNAMTGIDISTHNVIRDWDAVAADGIDFVMLRVGYRGYGSGKILADDKFRTYYNAAKKVGLKVGAYFFSQAITEEEAVEEAVFTAETIKGCELDFPVAYDWEIIFHDDESRTNDVPVETLTDCCLAFCQNIESFGYQPMIYQNKRTSLFKLDLPRLKDIPFWLAEYSDEPTYIYNYDMWQYSCTGAVAGIDGDVDLNLCYRDYSKEGAPEISVPLSDELKAMRKAPGETGTETGTGTDGTAAGSETETTATTAVTNGNP